MDKMFCTYFLFFLRKNAIMECRRTEAAGTHSVYLTGVSLSTPLQGETPCF